MNRREGIRVSLSSSKLSVLGRILLVAVLFGVISVGQFRGSGPALAASIGTGECAQTVSGSLTGSVAEETSRCVVALKSGSGTWTVPVGVGKVDVLIVGGGGSGGGSRESGGGGAGSFYEETGISVTSGSTLNVSVGSGGVTPVGSSNGGASGGTTVFDSLSAYGGGGGANTSQTLNAPVLRPASPGGSGGGDIHSPVGPNFSTTDPTVIDPAGPAIAAGTAGVGFRNPGGTAPGVFQRFTDNKGGSFWFGGGGGGAGGAGLPFVWTSDGTYAGSGYVAGSGGAGRATTLFSSATATALGVGDVSGGNVMFAAGGGGSGNFDSNALPGYVAMNPKVLIAPAVPGAIGSNTGGGGHGFRANGKAGVAVVRYTIPKLTALTASEPTSSTVKLSWTVPEGMAPVTGYKVERTPSGANTWTLAATTPNAASSTSASVTVTGLSSLTSYDFRVTPQFFNGDGFVSLSASATTKRPAQTVTWSPTNTTTQTAGVPLVPSARATSSGEGVITYSVVSQGTTKCSVDTATGAVTFVASGTCVVRATSAATTAFDSGYKDVSFTLMTAIPETGAVQVIGTGLIATVFVLCGLVLLMTSLKRRFS